MPKPKNKEESVRQVESVVASIEDEAQRHAHFNSNRSATLLNLAQSLRSCWNEHKGTLGADGNPTAKTDG